MHLVVNKPVKLVINAQDVIHDVGCRISDEDGCCSGIPTTIWFTPKYTTAEMKKITVIRILYMRFPATDVRYRSLLHERTGDC